MISLKLRIFSEEVKVKTTGERNPEINLLKFIALVFILLIHKKLPGISGILVRGVAAASVPVFFMISGYYSYDVPSEKIGKRARRILALMLIANLLYLIWDICVELLSGNPLRPWIVQNCSPKRFLIFLLTNESPFRGHLWFLGALLYAYLFLFPVRKLMECKTGKTGAFLRKNHVHLFFWLSVFLFALNLAGGELLTIYGKNIQIPYIRNWLFTGIPSFAAAYCIHAREEQLLQYTGKRGMCLILAVAFVLNLAEVFYAPACEFYVTTLGTASAAFMLTIVCRGECRSRILCFLGKAADKYGLWVYILQIIVIKNLEWFCKEYGIEENPAVQYFSPVFVFFVTFLLALIPVRIQYFVKAGKRNPC